jgi:hypothetical protein
MERLRPVMLLSWSVLLLSSLSPLPLPLMMMTMSYASDQLRSYRAVFAVPLIVG